MYLESTNDKCLSVLFVQKDPYLLGKYLPIIYHLSLWILFIGKAASPVADIPKPAAVSAPPVRSVASGSPSQPTITKDTVVPLKGRCM